MHSKTNFVESEHSKECMGFKEPDINTIFYPKHNLWEVFLPCRIKIFDQFFFYLKVENISQATFKFIF